MGYLQLNTGLIADYSIELVNESVDYRVIHLSICTDVSFVTYRICADIREPDIDENLSNALEFVKTNEEANIKIHEYLERMYIFITYPDGKTIQYTANRI